MPILLQINVDANNGSNGSIARDIGDIALSKGWRSVIVYGRKHIPSRSELIRVGNDWDVRWHGLFTRLTDLHGLGSYFATKRLVKKIKELNPNIIHLHNIHGYYINYKILFDFINKHNIPVVWTFHDCWPFTGHCSHYIGYNCYKWISSCNNCPARTDYPTSWFVDNSSFNFTLKRSLFTRPKKLAVVTVSNWLKSVTDQSFFSKYPVTVIYDGIDTDSFRYRQSDLKVKLGIEGKYVLMSAAANWSTSKGWDDYLKVASQLPQKYIIILIGVTSEQQKTLPPNIIGIQRVEGKEKLAEFYSIADVLLNLSYAETFGMTTAEAMACGTPGISYNITACPELLTKDTGLVVEPGDIGGVLNAIDIMTKKGRLSYSDACRSRVLSNFDFKKVNNQYFDIYGQLINEFNDKF